MTLPLKDPYVIGPDGKLEPVGVQQNFEQLAAHFPLLPGTDNFQRAPQARVYNNAAIVTTTGVDAYLTFNSERYDNTPAGVSEQHSTSANTSRLTCRVDGLYVISGHVSFASNATGYRMAWIRLNGSGSTILAFQTTPALSGAPTRLTVSTLWRLGVGDYVELGAVQNSGGNLNVDATANFSPEFAFAWLSP